MLHQNYFFGAIVYMGKTAALQAAEFGSIPNSSTNLTRRGSEGDRSVWGGDYAGSSPAA